MLGFKSNEYVAETVIAISGTPDGVLPVKSLTLAGPPLTIGQSSDAGGTNVLSHGPFLKSSKLASI